MIKPRMIICCIALALLAACGASEAAGDAERGRQIFDGSALMAGESAPRCATCHAIVPSQVTGRGPSLFGIADRAAQTVPGQSAEVYLRTSILHPDEYLAEGYQDGIMYRRYADALSDQQVNDLVAYLLTLKGE